jgi:hypothetical protein
MNMNMNTITFNWQDNEGDGDTFEANTPFVVYSVFQGGGGWCAEFKLANTCHRLSARRGISCERAKEICENDFKLRVYRCLVTESGAPMQLPYDDGSQSFDNRQSYTSNPHPKGDWKHDEWDLGWREQEKTHPEQWDVEKDKFVAGYETPCDCRDCTEKRGDDMMRFFVCPSCGNKRCPHANHHKYACTKSNIPGQSGSAFE